MAYNGIRQPFDCECDVLAGKRFLGSAGSSPASGRSRICCVAPSLPGIELVLNVLLAYYKKYRPKLHKVYGHRIEKLGVDACLAYGLRPMRPTLAKELAGLSAYFSKHLLRYAGIQDILIAPSSIARDRFFGRIAAVLRLAEREIARPTGSNTK